MNNNESRGVVKTIVEMIMTNKGKNVKSKYAYKNKLIVFTCVLISNAYSIFAPNYENPWEVIETYYMDELSFK